MPVSPGSKPKRKPGSSLTGSTLPTLVSSASFCASGCTVTTGSTLFNGVLEGPVGIVASAPGGIGAVAGFTLDYFNFRAATPAR